MNDVNRADDFAMPQKTIAPSAALHKTLKPNGGL